ncbi:RDD family protein [Paradesertivirga mongoliensis]|uniref:RDD family protein n=1 Tax=Paradesertivirga mongoliensis TaxID=2100740 RepID=A0ABW4ZGW0_9SPHI|nr:RDD family protein [Pedobacter mongoliensis]
MHTIRITTPQNIDIDYEYAGLGERILARLIDLGVFFVLFLAAAASEGVFHQFDNLFKGFPIAMAFWLLLLAFYDLICEAFFNGQSVGKRIMKIKVISLDGSQPSFGQYLMRWLFRIVDFGITFQLGALVSVVLTEKNQRIGDLVAGTTLIRTHPRTNFNQVAFAPVDENYQPVFQEASQLRNSEIVLIHEVIENVRRSDNFPLLYQTAARLKQHLNIVAPYGMDDLAFLETLVKDYNYAAVREEV